MSPELGFRPSELTRGARPEGILGWFAFEFLAEPETSLDHQLFHGEGDGWERWSELQPGFTRTVEDLIARDRLDGFPRRASRYGVLREPFRAELPFVVVNLSQERDHECLRREEPALRRFADDFLDVFEYDFHVRFLVEADGTPRVLATRTVLIAGDERLAHLPPCYSNLADGANLLQGFFIDPDWLFGDLIDEVADQVLRLPESLSRVGDDITAGGPDLAVERIFLVDELGLETYRPEDRSHGEVLISADLGALRPRHAAQTRGFLAVAAMLLLSLGTGFYLLARSVREDLADTRRRENLMAAVTHELRTPLAAIRLYGEMLRDGWTTSEERRAQYYDRILTEARRLETLVDRVLEQTQVRRTQPTAAPADLGGLVEECVRHSFPGSSDIRLELDRGLPPVMLVPEGIHSIVTNLVENALKYAPPAEEPILVRTALAPEAGWALLEVLDRGAGVPPEEREQVFRAFHRSGDEATRSAPGTGLGLHLVRLHARAMGGEVQVDDRPGGGARFRVRLPLAEGEGAGSVG
jgi:signal transduction histidine kinase